MQKQELITSLLTLGLLLSGCGTLRDTRLDHRLPARPPAAVNLDAYEPVQTRADGQDPDVAVAVAMSGGGHRAANFAMGVLMALEDFTTDGRRYDLLREIDYFSTVSGGGFAAGTYLSTLYDHLRANRGARSGYSLTQALTGNEGSRLFDLRRDYQGTIFGGLFNLRCLGYADSGDVFERKLDQRVLGSRYREKRYSMTLGDVFHPRGTSGAVALPYWVPNATVYENGARFPFTPDVLAAHHVTAATHNMKHVDVRDDVYRMPLAVGVKASASFPVAFPATTLHSSDPTDALNPFLHLADGGLADNMGYRTAVDLLMQDNAERKILLIVDAYKGVTFPHSRDRISPSGLGAAYRTMKISLDSDHGRLRADVARLAQLAGQGDDQSPIQVIFLDFAQLKPVLTARIEDIREELARLRQERVDATVRRIQREVDAMLKRRESALKHAQQTFAMYHDARAVATSLNISRGKQRLLLRAGKAAVETNRDLLEQHLVSHLEPVAQDK